MPPFAKKSRARHRTWPTLPTPCTQRRNLDILCLSSRHAPNSVGKISLYPKIPQPMDGKRPTPYRTGDLNKVHNPPCRGAINRIKISLYLIEKGGCPWTPSPSPFRR